MRQTADITRQLQSAQSGDAQALNGLVMPRPEIFVSSANGKFAEDGTISDEATNKVIGVWLKHFEPWLRQ